MDRYYPLPPDPRFFRMVQVRMRWSLIAEAAFDSATILIWPWLTFAALMIFQISMRRRGVRPMHVLRCVIYSCDLSTWYFTLSLLATIGLMVYATFRAGQISWFLQQRIDAWLVFGLWVLRFDRLWTSYRKYLRFDHPFWTALASQVIVVLAGGVLLFWGGRLAMWVTTSHGR